MNDVEKTAYYNFIEKHKDCKCKATIGGKISVEIIPTGLGNEIICKCNICGEIEDITDVDVW